jgi:hypothetical protein
MMCYSDSISYVPHKVLTSSVFIFILKHFQTFRHFKKFRLWSTPTNSSLSSSQLLRVAEKSHSMPIIQTKESYLDLSRLSSFCRPFQNCPPSSCAPFGASVATFCPALHKKISTDKNPLTIEGGGGGWGEEGKGGRGRSWLPNTRG